MTEVVQLVPQQVVSVVKNESPRRIITTGIGGVAGPAGPLGASNRLINGDGRFNQRGVASAADDAYAWDRHYVLTQTAAIGTTTISDPANGIWKMMRLTQSQVTAQRMGVAQIIESANCQDLRGQIATLLGKVRCSISTNIRYAIIAQGVADVVTSDIVNSWTNGTFTASNFFLAGLSITSVGVLAVTANTIHDFSLSGTFGGFMTNVLVFIWTESAVAQNVTLDVAWEFVKGDYTASTYPLTKRSIGEELRLCQRYCCKSFPVDTTPAQGVGPNPYIAGFAYATNAVGSQMIFYPVTMRTLATLTLYKPNLITGTNGQWQWYDGVSAWQDSTGSVVNNNIMDTGFAVNMTVTDAVSKAGYILQGNWLAQAEL